MAGRLYKPKAKSFWILVRRLLCRKNHKPPAAVREEDGEKSGFLSRSSLEELLVTDSAEGDGAGAICRCATKHGQPVAVLQPAGLHGSVLTGSEAAAGGDRDGAAVHRRFMFGGFRRRLLMRRPWRSMLVAIPE